MGIVIMDSVMGKFSLSFHYTIDDLVTSTNTCSTGFQPHEAAVLKDVRVGYVKNEFIGRLGSANHPETFGVRWPHGIFQYAEKIKIGLQNY